MNVDEILSGFEPVFRARLERNVFESTVEATTSTEPFMPVFSLIFAHFSYVAYHFASRGGNWLLWVLAGFLAMEAVAIPIAIPFLCRFRRMRRKLAEESGWSIAQFQRLAAQFPDRKKKKLLKELERNLRMAAAAME